MDASTLRLILLIFGLLFLAGLYWWEQRRSSDDDYEGDDADDRFEDSFDGPGEAESAQIRRRRATDDLYLARFRDPADSGQVAADEGLIVQLYLVSRGAPFSGEEIEEIAERYHLLPGDMDIYHRRNVGGGAEHAQFSMANLVKPGTFPFPNLRGFSTPGLALFARLDGAPSDLMVFDELVQTARSMAAELDADLQQADRTLLTTQAAKQMRAQVVERLQARGRARG